MYACLGLNPGTTIYCVTLAKSLHFFGPHILNRDDAVDADADGSLLGLNEIMHIKWLALLEHCKCSVNSYYCDKYMQ